jgi:hypothetical protein
MTSRRVYYHLCALTIDSLPSLRFLSRDNFPLDT